MNNHFPFLPEDAWKKKYVEEARRAIIARLQHEQSKNITFLLGDHIQDESELDSTNEALE